ncbi:MAG: hypothetical protein JRC54_05130 [Deltaproteobacteria bacterium]|nr:hypothetical protein [Deltaproteobacteria bacterium]
MIVDIFPNHLGQLLYKELHLSIVAPYYTLLKYFRNIAEVSTICAKYSLRYINPPADKIVALFMSLVDQRGSE